MQLGEQLHPLYDLGRGRLGSVESGMLVLLHDLLLSVETSAVGIRTNRVSHLKGKIATCFSGVLMKIIAQLLSATVVFNSMVAEREVKRASSSHLRYGDL